MFAARGRSADDVGRTSTEEYFADKPQAAVRPLNSVLDLAKITATGFPPRDWRDALAEYSHPDPRAPGWPCAGGDNTDRFVTGWSRSGPSLPMITCVVGLGRRACSVVWLVVAAALALLIGRGIRLADRRSPGHRGAR